MATRLEAGGYARREMDPTDRRRVLIRASPSGARQGFGLFDDLYQVAATMNASYEHRELEMLIELLRRYRQLLAQQAATLRTDIRA
jgi:DNA-binding MarR family transcriptional regulator